MKIAFLSMLDQNHGHTELLVRIMLIEQTDSKSFTAHWNRIRSDVLQVLDLNTPGFTKVPDQQVDFSLKVPGSVPLFGSGSMMSVLDQTQPLHKFMETNKPTNQLNGWTAERPPSPPRKVPTAVWKNLTEVFYIIIQMLMKNFYPTRTHCSVLKVWIFLPCYIFLTVRLLMSPSWWTDWTLLYLNVVNKSVTSSSSRAAKSAVETQWHHSSDITAVTSQQWHHSSDISCRSHMLWPHCVSVMWRLRSKENPEHESRSSVT